jgi:exportin-2 (importin alpha re-exporter)
MVALVQQPQSAAGADAGDDDPDAGLTAIDFEEQTAGYQAAYSRLAAAEGAREDPVAYVPDVSAFVAQQLRAGVAARPRVRELAGAADPAVVGPFLQAMRGAGIL